MTLHAMRRSATLWIAAALLAAGLAGPALAQNSQQAAELAVRIQQLEEQLRVLTGQVEGLQFQLTQMQTMLEKQAADNEFRFQQLEGGGAPAKPQAATEPGAGAPAAQLPPSTAAETNAPLATQDAPVAGDVPVLGAEDQPMGPMLDLGESADPLVGTGSTGEGQLGATPGEGELANLGGGRPLDLSLGEAQPSSGDAQAQYAAGYEAIVRGDYTFAEEQFRQFLELYPDDPQAADATNWLGEALIQRGAFAEAADVLITGYQKFPQAERAPDILLKLGVALAGAGETEMACRTLGEVSKRYDNLGGEFATRLADERSKANCPA